MQKTKYISYIGLFISIYIVCYIMYENNNPNKKMMLYFQHKHDSASNELRKQISNFSQLYRTILNYPPNQRDSIIDKLDNIVDSESLANKEMIRYTDSIEKYTEKYTENK